MPLFHYCNALFTGPLTRTKRREHIGPVLAALHWLLVSFRSRFKDPLLIYKVVHGLGPSYIANSLFHYLPLRTLPSVLSRYT